MGTRSPAGTRSSGTRAGGSEFAACELAGLRFSCRLKLKLLFVPNGIWCLLYDEKSAAGSEGECACCVQNTYHVVMPHMLAPLSSAADGISGTSHVSCSV